MGPIFRRVNSFSANYSLRFLFSFGTLLFLPTPGEQNSFPAGGLGGPRAKEGEEYSMSRILSCVKARITDGPPPEIANYGYLPASRFACLFEPRLILSFL